MGDGNDHLANALDGASVRLTFELGSETLTVGELARLDAGHLFRFRTSLERPVLIMANGTPFARGELIRVEDRLAVRLVEGNADAA